MTEPLVARQAKDPRCGLLVDQATALKTERGGRLVIVDLDQPANRSWWLLFAPLLLMPMTAEQLRGRLPNYVRDAGFTPVESRDRWMQLLTFWVVTKPKNPPGEKP